MRLPAKWPVEIKRGSSIVRIYRNSREKKGRIYDEFKLAYYDMTGRRVQESFSDFEKARKAADGIASSISSGDVDAVTLKGKEAAVYKRALQSLAPSKIALDTAAAEYANALAILGGASVLEAARYFAKKHPQSMPRKTVPEVVGEFIQAKQKAGLSGDYLTDLRSRLGRFANAFQEKILEVQAGEIRDWLDSLDVGPRSHNNFLKTLKTIFRFAKKRGYLPKDHDEIDGLDLIKERDQAVTTYTPAELRELISRADWRFIPFLVIGAFAGLRSKEIERLEWSDVDLKGKHIEVKANKAKTASRRIVPILPNLAKWLAQYAQPSGRVVPFADFGLQQREMCKELRNEAGEIVRTALKWKRNALRHSYISYRITQIKSIAEVSIEAGNSPQIIHKNYRELVKEDAAQEWFGIEPAAIPLPPSARRGATRAVENTGSGPSPAK